MIAATRAELLRLLDLAEGRAFNQRVAEEEVEMWVDGLRGEPDNDARPQSFRSGATLGRVRRAIIRRECGPQPDMGALPR